MKKEEIYEECHKQCSKEESWGHYKKALDVLFKIIDEDPTITERYYKIQFMEAINWLNKNDKETYAEYVDDFWCLGRDVCFSASEPKKIIFEGKEMTAEYFGGEFRICDVCGDAFDAGYYDGDGTGKYYCCDDCLHTDYTDEEWEEQYDEDGDSYYTEWY